MGVSSRERVSSTMAEALFIVFRMVTVSPHAGIPRTKGRQ